MWFDAYNDSRPYYRFAFGLPRGIKVRFMVKALNCNGFGQFSPEVSYEIPTFCKPSIISFTPTNAKYGNVPKISLKFNKDINKLSCNVFKPDGTKYKYITFNGSGSFWNQNFSFSNDSESQGRWTFRFTATCSNDKKATIDKYIDVTCNSKPFFSTYHIFGSPRLIVSLTT